MSAHSLNSRIARHLEFRRRDDDEGSGLATAAKYGAGAAAVGAAGYGGYAAYRGAKRMRSDYGVGPSSARDWATAAKVGHRDMWSPTSEAPAASIRDNFDYGVKPQATPAIKDNSDYGVKPQATPAIKDNFDYGVKPPAPYVPTTAPLPKKGGLNVDLLRAMREQRRRGRTDGMRDADGIASTWRDRVAKARGEGYDNGRRNPLPAFAPTSPHIPQGMSVSLNPSARGGMLTRAAGTIEKWASKSGKGIGRLGRGLKNVAQGFRFEANINTNSNMSTSKLLQLNARLDRAVEFARRPQDEDSTLTKAAKIAAITAGGAGALYGGGAIARGVADAVGRSGGARGLGRALRNDTMGTAKRVFMRGARLNNQSAIDAVEGTVRGAGFRNARAAQRATQALPPTTPYRAPESIVNLPGGPGAVGRDTEADYLLWKAQRDAQRAGRA